MHQSRRLSVGVDVPKAAMAGADSAPAPHAAVVSLGHIGTRQGDIDQLLRRLQATSPHLGFGYEAGPCGSWLSRSLPQKAQGCWGVAPSLSPTKPGDRGTTNRQDASKRARLLRAGTLPPVSGPALEEAALRALCRAHAEAIRALQTAQCRLTAFLLRHARRAPGRPPGGRPIAEGAARSSVPPGAAARLARRPSSGHRPPGTACASGTRAHSPRADLAARPRRRRPPGPAWRAMDGRRDHGGRTRRPHLGRASPTADALPGLHASRRRAGRAAPPGWPPQDGPRPCPPGPGRRRLGLSLPRQRALASAPTPGKGAQGAPREQLAGPAPLGSTLPPAPRPRAQRPPSGRRHRTETQCVEGGHGPGGHADALARDR